VSGKLVPYEKYKDSGVEWLGSIPEEWEIIPVKHFAQITMGQSPDSDDCNKDGLGLPFLQGCAEFGDVAPMPEQYCDVSSKVCEENDILFSVRAPVGRLNLADQKYGIGRGLCSIRSNESQEFLFWSLNFNKWQLDAVSTGSTYESVSIADVGNISVPLPPMDKQQALASYLKTQTQRIDTLIKEQRELIELLREKRRALIFRAVTKGIGTKAKMKDSGVEWIGEVPESWEVLRVKNVFEMIIDPAPDGNSEVLLSIYTDIGVKPRSELEPKGNKATTTDGYWRVKKGDFIVNKLLAWMGAIGLSSYEGVTSPAYDILRPRRPISGLFYHELFRSRYFAQEMKKYSRGIMDMRLRLYFEEFGSIFIPYPPKGIQDAIEHYLVTETSKIDVLIVEAESTITHMQEHRFALISAVVTGKVRVPA
jgi:type I restriction enzyme S subunit